MKIIVPKRYAPVTPTDFHIFLAGPVLGGGDWQATLIQHFMNVSHKRWSDAFAKRLLPTIKFIVPCRWDEDHPLSPYFVTAFETIVESEGIDDAWKSQTAWEVMHLREMINRQGAVLLFGLFPESKTSPRADGHPYAQDTFGEIGRWATIAQYENNEDMILFGFHKDFIGLKTIKDNLFLHSDGEAFLEENCVDVSSPEDLADKLADFIEEGYSR